MAMIDTPATPDDARTRSPRTAVACVLLVGLAAGCYDAQALTQAKREQAERMRLEDVDLGKYRITLPKLPHAPVGGVVDFHAFGQVPNRNRKAVEKEIKQGDAVLRNRMLIAVRTLTHADVEDPELTNLREKIAKVVNSSLNTDAVKGVGFYDLRFSVL